MSQPDGGPAFPRQSGTLDMGGSLGMSLRDYFAGQALAQCIRLASLLHPGGMNELPWPPSAAKAAYEIADAMLRAREQS